MVSERVERQDETKWCYLHRVCYFVAGRWMVDGSSPMELEKAFSAVKRSRVRRVSRHLRTEDS
jgi:hypothetical protein